MGDLIEITTWPRHLSQFYKITSNALSFEIRAAGNAAIGLSRKPTINCDFWIIIGERQRCWIKKGDNGHRELAVTRGILTMEEYRRFWLTWHSGLVSLGQDGQSDPIVSCANNVNGMKYITFSVVKLRNPVHWRFEISPVMEKVKYKPISSGDELHWVTYAREEEFPDGLLIGGYENENLYIARAHHRGSLTPGKFVPSAGTAFIPWGGQANEKLEFEVLCGFDGVWVPTSDERIPVNAYVAGYSEDGLERLYIGRALYEGHLIPGKVAPSHSVCYISYQGRELAVSKYDILVVSNVNERCANNIYIPDRVYVRPGIEEYEEPDSDFSNETDEENVAL